MSEKIPGLAEHQAKEYERAVERVVTSMRDTIDRFERSAKALPVAYGLRPETSPRVAAASRAINELHWGIANAHVDGLIRDAIEADQSAREAAND